MYVPQELVTIPHVFVKKLQLCDCSTAPSINEAVNIISITSFTKQSMADRMTLETEQELVNMDVALDQAMQHRSAIGRNLAKSYKVSTTHKAVISLSLC